MSTLDDETRLLLVIALYLHGRRRRIGQRGVCVRPTLRRRRQQGEIHNLLQEMRLTDRESHFQYLRMRKERFDSLLLKVGGILIK